MPRTGYRRRLETLRKDVLLLGELVTERLRAGLDAIEDQDNDLAWEVLEGDDEVNDLYLDLEQDCIDLLALQQPVASDLRFVAASFKILTDLERVGDLAANLGEYALYTDRRVFEDVPVTDLGREAATLLDDALAAYAEDDPNACITVADADEALDERCESAGATVVRSLVERDPDLGEEQAEFLLQDVSRVLLTVRDLERVGDHAVNVAARTRYMVENDDALIE